MNFGRELDFVHSIDLVAEVMVDMTLGWVIMVPK